MSTTRKILELNAFDMNNPTGLPAEMETLVVRRQKTFGPTSMLFYKRPLHIVRAEGVWLHCAGNVRFLDTLSSFEYKDGGRMHRLVAALASQAGPLPPPPASASKAKPKAKRVFVPSEKLERRPN